MPPVDKNFCITLDLSEPSQKLLDYAKENINEDPDTRCQILEDFRDMIFEKNECQPDRTDDAYLLRFLRARNFIIPLAHRLLVNYYRFKEKNSNLFENVKLLQLKPIGDDNVLLIPPYVDRDGRRLMNLRIGNWDVNKFKIEDIFKASIAIMQLGVMEQSVQILGAVCIFDLAGLTMQHAMQINPTIAKIMIDMMAKASPMKIHALHILNQPWGFEMIYSIFKPFLNETMRSRIFFHGSDLTSLHKFVVPDDLPEKYGGKRPEYNYTDWLIALKDNEIVLTELRKLGYVITDEDIKKFIAEFIK